jgi:hypothetical protein
LRLVHRNYAGWVFAGTEIKLAEGLKLCKMLLLQRNESNVMDRKNEKTYKATREEARKILKAAKVGATFNVSIRVDLAIENDPEHIFRDGGFSSVSVSKKEALRLADALLSETMEQKGARLPIRSYDRESYQRGTSLEKRWVTSYWIG